MMVLTAAALYTWRGDILQHQELYGWEIVTLRAMVPSVCFLFAGKSTSQLLAYGLYFEDGMGKEALSSPAQSLCWKASAS